MAELPQLPTTQRAYTLRLCGHSADDQTWRDTLWKTHVAVNRGAKAFGDWLLTLRGGLCHTLADATVPVGKGKPDREPTAAERRHRTIILALSWLSVESHETERDAPVAHFVPVGDGVPQTVEALRTILQNRSVDESEIADWLRDCGDSLKANIRESAVWVNRSRAFDAAVRRVGPSLNGAEIWDIFERFFGTPDEYLGTPGTAGHDYAAFATWCRSMADEPVTGVQEIRQSLLAAFESVELPQRLGKTSRASNKVQSNYQKLIESLSAGCEPSRFDYREIAELADEQASKASAESKADIPPLVVAAGGWLSNRCGVEDGGADFAVLSSNYERIGLALRNLDHSGDGISVIAHLAELLGDIEPDSRNIEGVLKLVGGPGHKSQTRNLLKTLNATPVVSPSALHELADQAFSDSEESQRKIDRKGYRAWATLIVAEVETACGFKYFAPSAGARRHKEFSVMLDHAARRVSQTHSWIKLAEGERNEFEKDARKIDKLTHEHPTIVEWLDQFCRDRSRDTGTADDDGYRIRKGAISDWADVVAKWGSAKCKTVDDRITAAREVQADPENDKPGDNQLYEALAQEEAKLVWFVNGQSDAQPLKDYVAAREAEHNKRRFKVPAYRHPDELRHPVFCDFGKSRWDIDFAVHRVRAKQANAFATVTRRQADVAKAETSLGKAKTEDKVAAAKEKLDQAKLSLKAAQEELAWLESHQGLRMKLWDGHSLENRSLIWQSKRLSRELTPTVPASTEERQPIEVTRANRLAQAAGNADEGSPLTVIGLFDLEEWNGRLQAPRDELNRIADIRDGIKGKKLSPSERITRVEKMISRLHWLVTYSAKLQPQGPWLDYARQHAEIVKPDPQYWPHAAENKSRQGKSKLILSRLPNLRVLSVDLGHRHAAACAVWEAISTKEMHDECIKAGGSKVPTQDAIHLAVQRPQVDGKPRGRVVYRRIAADKLADGTPHPAPWARLDRQFLIKLQGEEERARTATDQERAAVESFEAAVGYVWRETRKPSDWRIDELMSNVVSTVRLGIRNHGDYARIAHGLLAEERQGMGNNAPTPLVGDKLVEHLADLLDRWHELTKSTRWHDDFARDSWQRHIAPRLVGVELRENADDMTAALRKAVRASRRNALKEVAQRLANESRVNISAEWQQAWQTRDEQWQNHLRWLSRWIMPRGKQQPRSIRNVGGLSLTRIATFKSLYQVQKAFFTRLKPDGKKPEPAGRGFGKRTLDALERMRQNRVKQLASRIVEAALGIGSEDRETHWEKGTKRPRQRIDEPRFAPCHAVVIENLTRYRPDELQTRRENRQLMTWASAQVKKHLTDQCQLHGLHLREVQPAYTSRQDFRTGTPGVRCVDVPIDQFLGTADGKPGYFVCTALRSLLKELPERDQPAADAWPEKLQLAREKVRKGSGKAWDRYVLDLYDHLLKPTTLSQEQAANRFARIPRRGEEIFVSADLEELPSDRKGPPGIHADLNAAGNIGLKALLDPDWHGAWSYVPATISKDGFRVAAEKSCAGASCLAGWQVGEVSSGVFRHKSRGGKPLVQADGEELQAAATAETDAKALWKVAQAATKKAMKAARDESDLNVMSARQTEVAAKAVYDEAKGIHSTMKKGISAKSVVNLWRFVSDGPPNASQWRIYSVFENLIQWRVIDRLRKTVGLSNDSEKEVE